MKKMDMLATLSSDSPGGALGNKSSSTGVSGVVPESSFGGEMLVVASVLAVVQSQISTIVLLVGGSVGGESVGGLIHSVGMSPGTATGVASGLTEVLGRSFLILGWYVGVMPVSDKFTVNTPSLDLVEPTETSTEVNSGTDVL